MNDELSKVTDVPSTNPGFAYAADIARLQRTGPLGPSDDAWLVLAHALSRFAELSEEELRQVVPQSADALAVSAVAMGLAPQCNVLRAARALRGLYERTSSPTSRAECMAELVIATQAMAEEQEVAGAAGLAFAMLSGLMSAFGTGIPQRAQGNVLAQLGRAARQLGAGDVARDMYESAIVVGYECDARDVVARGLLGLGVLALTRGNYPNARQQFERALLNADRARDPELIRTAHHGLLNCALAAGDLDSAMVNGWNVLRLCIAPDSRAEALMNMAEICRMTGEYDAAIHVYVVAMEWTSRRRVRLHALSGALRASVEIQRVTDARRFLAELEELLPTETDTFARASIGVELAESLLMLGDVDLAATRLDDAIVVAHSGDFHEIVHRAEQVAATLGAIPAPAAMAPISKRHRRPHRSEHFRMVLKSLNGLSAATL